MNENRDTDLFHDLIDPICFALFASFLVLLPELVAPASNKNEINYLAGKQIVETIPFNDLQTSTCSDGTEIKVTPSAEYPEDKIVQYKSVVFPVENHDGESVVVATYTKIRK